MALYQSLNLSQQQRQMQIMAPQMRQSLEILQLPAMELRELIQKEMEHNPLIEDVVMSQEVAANTSSDSPDEIMRITSEFDEDMHSGKVKEVHETQPSDTANQIEADFDSPVTLDARDEDSCLDFEIDTLKTMDEESRDYFFESEPQRQFSAEDGERRQYMFDSLRQPISLQQHLLSQLESAGLPEEERLIGEIIIGSLDASGFLASSLDDLEMQTCFPRDAIRRVLSVVQTFDPQGIASENLRDCLLAQLSDAKGEVAQTARDIVSRHLDDLSRKKYQTIANALKCSSEMIECAVKLILSLNPRPAADFDPEPPDYIIPEVEAVRGDDGRWHVVIDDDQAPHIQMNSRYLSLLDNPNVKADVKAYIRNRARSGSFLIKSMELRQKTIALIAGAIVNEQNDFFEKGVSHLKPMIMLEIAEKVGVHETTVSRTVSNKYIKSPRGVFELKYFFSHGIKTGAGTEMSNKTVQDRIAAIVQAESQAAPLSDQAIQEKLKEEGIAIARRTVVKYRKILKIPSSHDRKRCT